MRKKTAQVLFRKKREKLEKGFYQQERANFTLVSIFLVITADFNEEKSKYCS